MRRTPPLDFERGAHERWPIEYDAPPPPGTVYAGPRLPWGAALALALVVALGLAANGRPIGSGDARATERVAASLVEEHDFDLDEHPEVEAPFSRSVGEHRLSVYPVLSAVVAVPVFAVSRLAFALDETGTALAGKWAACLFSGAATGAVFLAVTRRRRSWAGLTALLFAFGTSVWSTSQALWQHPAAVMFLAVAVLFLVLAEEDPAWVERAGLPLGLAVAARHADAALVAALAAVLLARQPRALPRFLLWALPGPLFVLTYNTLYFGGPLAHGFAGAGARFDEPWGRGHLGLLASPAKGLLVFTPVALVALLGLVDHLRRRDLALAAPLGAGILAHWLLVGRWGEWHGGESWGPRLMTDVLPLLFVFLPEGLDVLPRLGTALGLVSVGVQALGAFGYDYRWERRHQRPASPHRPELWAWDAAPIPFHLRPPVVILAAAAVVDGRAVVREHPVVLRAPSGSRITFGDGRFAVSGSDEVLGHVHLQRGARVEGAALRLRGRWDALFLRVRGEARARPLELRITGRGRGPLFVGERTFWTDAPRYVEYAANGRFEIRHPYHFPDSGGPDVTVTVGLGGGDVSLESVVLAGRSASRRP